MKERESDEDYRKRMFEEKCEGWGAFWSLVLEGAGSNLDELGAVVECPRKKYSDG